MKRPLSLLPMLKNYSGNYKEPPGDFIKKRLGLPVPEMIAAVSYSLFCQIIFQLISDFRAKAGTRLILSNFL
jgi:hypothetical protein